MGAAQKAHAATLSRERAEQNRCWVLTVLGACASDSCSCGAAHTGHREAGHGRGSRLGNLSTSEHSAQLRKAVIASTIGTTIEWYDFFIYGTAAGLVFGKLYFPNEDPLTATLAAFGTYFIGFVGRPIGAAIFGHYGDRIGRKATLIATLLCMGIASPSRCPVTSPIVSDAERCT